MGCTASQLSVLDVKSAAREKSRPTGKNQKPTATDDAVFGYTGQDESEIPRDVTRVRVDPSLKVIPINAFRGCAHLEEVELCDGLERMDDHAFYHCVSLKGIIVIPATVRMIGESAFMGCNKLEEVKLCEGLERIGGTFYCSSLKRINIPSTVQVIDKREFYGCAKLEEVVLCDGLEQIEERAFYSCSSLEFIRIPSTVHAIGSGAFGNCRDLAEVDLPEGLGLIEDTSFVGCSSLKRISIPSTIREIGVGAFASCRNLVEVNLPEGLGRIEDSLFCECSSLKRITIPSTVQHIGGGAFSGCKQLEEVIIHDGLQTIGCRALSNCNALRQIKIPSTVRAIGRGVFQKCESLNRINLPLATTMDFNGAFSGCRELMTVELCADIRTIDKSTFENCSSLRNIVIPPRASGCDDLLRIFGSSKSITDALANRFSGLPIHQLCYYQSHHSIQVVLDRLKHTHGFESEAGLTFSNDEANKQDCLGMTPLHVLACSTRQNLDLYQIIIANQPKNLIVKDKWGCYPLFYAILGNAPPDIIQYIIGVHTADFPNVSLNWEKMGENLCRAGATQDTVLRLLGIQQTFFPGQMLDWQKFSREMAISCLVRCNAFEQYPLIMRSTVEAFSASGAHQELVQSLKSIEQSSLPDMLATVFPYQNKRNWQLACERSWFIREAFELFRFLAKCCISERLDTIGSRKWKLECESEIRDLINDQWGWPRELSIEASFEAIQSKMASYEQKYHILKNALSLLELALWKCKIDESMQRTSVAQIAYVKGQCLFSCGADVVIPNVLGFLI